MKRPGRLSRQLRCGIAAFTALLLATGLAAADPLPRGLAEARREIHGLRLHLSVPQAHYGPGEPVGLYLTLVNSGAEALRLPADLRFVALWTVAGKEETYPQDAPEQVSGAHPAPGGVRALKPGERAVFRLTVRPPRSALIHGLYPLRVCCDLASPLGGTLVSGTSTVKIQYKVMVVF